MVLPLFTTLTSKIKTLSLTVKITTVAATAVAVGGSVVTVIILNDQNSQMIEMQESQDANPSSQEQLSSEATDEGLENEDETNESDSSEDQLGQTLQNIPNTSSSSNLPSNNASPPTSSNPYEMAMAGGEIGPDVIYGVCPPKKLFNSNVSYYYALGAIGVQQNMDRNVGWRGETEQAWELFITRPHIGGAQGQELHIFKDGTDTSEVLPNTVRIGLSLWHMGTYEWGLIQDLPKKPDTISSDGSRGSNNEWSIVFGYSLVSKTVSWYIIGNYPAHRWSKSEMSARDIAAMDNLAKNIENYIHELDQRFAAKCPELL